MKGNLGKIMALVMCLAMIMSLGACSQGHGEDVMNGQEEKSNTSKLIDEAWASQNGEPGGESYAELESLAHVGEKVQDISMELLKASLTEGENGMISPVSILMAMTMAENGAAGTSLEQMEEAFGCSAEDLSYWLKAWRSSLKTSDETNMNVANSFWFRDLGALDVKEEYLKDISFYFDAQAFRSAFNEGTVTDMNQWCDDNTYGMIEKIIESLGAQDMAVILNATAFEGVWDKNYEDFQVSPGEIFYAENGSKESATMLYSREATYIEGNNMTGFRKPYKDGYSFVALLPDEGASVADCVAALDGDAFRSLLENARTEKVDAVIPEFTSAYRVDNLVQTFENMGITDIFSPAAADLSAMAALEDGRENLFVSGIIHKTFIEVNRKGTRAAAVTGMKVGTTAFVPEQIYTVRLDRPFIYAIVDDATDTPMFMGTTMSVASEE